MVTRDEELKWAYLLDPCFELTNTAGKPLTDGYIEVYIAGTRNKYYCASDFAGTLHPFQIPLDSLGSNIVLANPDNAYDVYVYNRFGNLIMSRYNVTPADGGAVISNTERINDLEELVVSAVTGLQGQIDDINEALDGKKDKQEEYSVTLSPTQTVSAIMQNENGEIEVIYQEIDLPEEVPNVDIVSPASTINITTHIDEETNTKTFSIDLSDLGHLEYGQFMATEDVYTIANMYRIKGNLNTTLDGKIQLHKGNSYHITVRGYYTCSDLANISDTLNYIECTSDTPMPVNVDNTVEGPQYFEISYDVFKLSADTNYYIAFAANAGKVSNLTVEIHSLSNISILDPEFNYQEGWGIDIVSSVISVDPTIFNDYSTHTEVYEATVTAIQAATSVVPEQLEGGQYINIQDNVISVTGLQPEGDYATREELDEAVTAVSSLIPDSEEVQFEEINLNDYALASAIPDVSDFTTHSEVYESIVTGVQLATSVIPDPLEAGQYVSIENNVITVTGLQEAGDYATHDELTEAVTGIEQDLEGKKDKQEAVEFEGSTTKTITKIVQDDNGVVSAIYEDIEMQNVLEAGQYVSIVNDVITVTGLQPEGDYATNSDVYDATVTAINIATGAIPDVSDFTTNDDVYESIVTAVNYVTALIPDAQIQSDWDQADDTQVDYIKNKPDLDIYVTHDELVEVVSAITGIGDYGQFYSTAVSGAAIMARTKGTIDVTNDGKIKLKKGSSYHVTVRGRYNQTTPNNVYGVISYIEYITNNNININVDKTITESQYFEISYDLYNLNSDTDYYVFFSGLGGTVNDLFIEIHAIGSVGAGVSGGAGTEYDAGWGIQILNNVISVNPSIFNDYVTENELVTAIQSVVTAIPAAQVQSDWTEDDTADPAYIKNKPDEYNLVAGQNIGIFVDGDDVTIAASGTDLSNYATDTEVYNATVTAIQIATGLIPEAQVQSDWNETNSSSKAYIKNKPNLNLYATDVEVSNAIASSITDFITESQVTALIPDSEEVQFEELDITQFAQVSAIPDTSDMATKTWVGNQGYLTEVPSTYATDTEVSEAIVTAIETVTAMIPDAQVQSDWTESDVSDPAYIQNKPTEVNLIAGDNVTIEVTGVSAIISSIGGSFTQLQANWNEADNTSPAYIQNKPSIPVVELNSSDQVTAIDGHTLAGGGGGGTTYTAGDYISIDNDEISVTGIGNLVAGDNITITESGNNITISAADGGSTYTAGKYISIDSNDVIAVTGLAPVSGSDGIAVNDNVVSLDTPIEIVAGDNIEITVTGVSAIISAQGGGATYTGGQYINIDSNDVISVTGLQVAGSYATTSDISDMATKTWVGNQGYLTAVPNTYATKVYVDGAVSGKQDKLTAGSNISISGNTIAVTGMPASPVQSDWSVTNTSSLAYIKNKPTIPAAPVQSDWSVTNTSSLAYIKNKPTIWGPTVYHYENSTTLTTGSGQQIGSTGTYIKFNPGNFLTSYTINSCRMIAEHIDTGVWYVILSIRLSDVIGSQWSWNANAITITSGHMANGPALFNCFSTWSGSPWCQIATDTTWETNMYCINRDIRNSSTADNNSLFINVEMVIHNS